MAGKRVADAFREIEELRSDIKKLRFAITTTAVALLVSVGTLVMIAS
jgi:hypothetical protein